MEQRTEIVSPFPKLFQEIWDKTGKCVRWLSTTKGEFSMDNILTVPIHHKMTLTAREAAEYSNIGINKIDSIHLCHKLLRALFHHVGFQGGNCTNLAYIPALRIADNASTAHLTDIAFLL